MSQKDKLSFEIEPKVGAKPIKFGMSPDEVKKILAEPEDVENYDNSRKIETEYFSDGIRVHYDENEKVDEMSFTPERKNLLIFDGKELFNPESVRNPLSVFLKHDSHPLEDVGFIIFEKLGVAITGYHDRDVSQRAITIFKKWDDLDDAEPIDLSKFAESK